MYDVGRGNPYGINPGYIILADTSESKIINYDEWLDGEDRGGQIHGYTVWRVFGQNPRDLVARYAMKFAGFAVRGDGSISFNSGSMNGASYWENQNRTLIVKETHIVKALVDAWKVGERGSFATSKTGYKSIWNYLNKYWYEVPKFLRTDGSIGYDSRALE